jgi:hypothetical protein
MTDSVTSRAREKAFAPADANDKKIGVFETLALGIAAVREAATDAA